MQPKKKYNQFPGLKDKTIQLFKDYIPICFRSCYRDPFTSCCRSMNDYLKGLQDGDPLARRHYRDIMYNCLYRAPEKDYAFVENLDSLSDAVEEIEE